MSLLKFASFKSRAIEAAIGGAIGGGAGAALDESNRGRGALIGGLSGAGLALGVGKIRRGKALVNMGKEVDAAVAAPGIERSKINNYMRMNRAYKRDLRYATDRKLERNQASINRQFNSIQNKRSPLDRFLKNKNSTYSTDMYGNLTHIQLNSGAVVRNESHIRKLDNEYRKLLSKRGKIKYVDGAAMRRERTSAINNRLF